MTPLFGGTVTPFADILEQLKLNNKLLVALIGVASAKRDSKGHIILDKKLDALIRDLAASLKDDNDSDS